MDIPIHAAVWCTDGQCGRSEGWIVNPTTQQVTHLVVKEEQGESTERLVPVESIADTSPGRISLNCSLGELARMEHFVDREYVPMWSGGLLAAVPEPGIMVLTHERVPEGELPIHPGAHVEAVDGHVGKVDGLLIERSSERITHLVLREGHIWGPKDVTIPVSQIDRIEADRIYLKLDKRGVGELPAVPIHRRLA